jgi:hypothetical protein
VSDLLAQELLAIDSKHLCSLGRLCSCFASAGAEELSVPESVESVSNPKPGSSTIIRIAVDSLVVWL